MICVFILELKSMIKWLQKSQNIILNVRNPLPKPYLGLAFEDHLFSQIPKNFPENDPKRIIFLWRNHPTVVCGKFQNIWRETNVNYCKSHNINLARRSSGGGTVFHDPGNLNISVFTNKKFYSRKFNLTAVKNSLEPIFIDKDFYISDRDDLFVTKDDEHFKISGSAARLDSRSAYHHFTLLFQSDKSKIRKSLTTPLDPSKIITHATKSVPSPTTNLLNSNQNLEENLSQFISQLNENLQSSLIEIEDFYEIESLEVDFDDIEKRSDELEQWEWIYGKTPKFSYDGRIINKGIDQESLEKFEI